MLIAYQQRTRLLLGDEMFKVYRDGDLTDYINEGRNQVAGEGECVVTNTNLTMTAGTQVYAFSSLVIPPSAISGGVGSPLKVRMISYGVGTGNKLVYPRAFEWLWIYTLDQPVPVPGAPKEWAQQGQGTFGTLYFNVPDIAYVLTLDTVCLPIPLINDTTAEAIPRLWTIAVPFYAAWRALLTHPQPQLDPDKMLQRYQQMMTMARTGANPQTMRHIWSQAPDIADANRYGIAGRGGA